MRTIGLFVGLVLAAVAPAEWPQFRGHQGQGHGGPGEFPVEWSESKNVAWKVSLAGEGWSSPTILNGAVWLTTATERGRSLRALAFDAESGRALHDVEVIRLEGVPSKHSKNTHASPTPILTPKRIYVHFGRHGTAALDHEGNVIWRNLDHRYSDGHGNGGSPVLWGELLIFNADGVDRQSIVALDAETGETRWTTRRGRRMSFATPLAIETERGPQLISPGGDEAGGAVVPDDAGALQEPTRVLTYTYGYNGVS